MPTGLQHTWKSTKKLKQQQQQPTLKAPPLQKQAAVLTAALHVGVRLVVCWTG
jgi:hypothetical protein